MTLAFDATTGRLAQKGCLVADAPVGGPCTSDPLLEGANDVVVTADGRDVLVTADEDEEDGRLLSYGRDPDTGALVRRQCLEDVYYEDESALSTGCEPAHALQGLAALAVSADGRAVFTAAGSYEDSYVAAFTRDAASGRLAQLGCTQIYKDYDECVQGPDIETPTALAASPDARSLYVTSADNAVQVFGASIAIASRRVDADRRGTFRVRVECPQALREGCVGRLMVAGRRQAAGFSVAPGGAELVRVALPARARRALRRHASVRVAVTALDRDRRVVPTAGVLTVRRGG